jgi:hypothetical protein
MDNWPTLLFSWWATSCCAVIIILRVMGRKIRSDTLFREDVIMLLALLPLFARMVLVHFVLLYGTNNIQTEGYEFTEEQIAHRVLGAKLVLAARISYAMFIWLCKLTVSEFLKRITLRIWRRSYELTLRGIRIFLLLTFIAVVISTLTECQPFENYWQVIPDPGPRCRQGYGFLLTMSVCDIISDILLIAFPIPVVLNSGQLWQRKLQMGALFSLSVVMIAVTATRVPMVVEKQGLQQYRSMWASCEILASAAVSNAVILGSFVRGKGTRRNKYRAREMSDSIERAPTRRPTVATLHPDDSDEELFRDLGYRVPDHLRERAEDDEISPLDVSRNKRVQRDSHHEGTESGITCDGSDSIDFGPKGEASSLADIESRRVNFFDVGNLLVRDFQQPPPDPHVTTLPLPSEVPIQSSHTTSEPRNVSSWAFLQDMGGILTQNHHGHLFSTRNASPQRPAGPPPTGVPFLRLERHDTQMSLQDVGGLLRQPHDPPANEPETEHHPG